MTDTVFALATAPGRAAVAVIRISGPAARLALKALAGGRVAPRRASVRTLRGADGEALDRGVVLWLPGPGSYTGEDCAELQVHGSAAVVDQCTEVLLAMGLRLADPGEFTRRAFENGKLDLDQAEAVADLVDAETSAQARQALGQLEGRLGARYRAWRGRLVEALARLEAAVDFSDEDVPTDVAAQARSELAALAADLDAALEDEPRGRRVRDGYRIAVIGAPNSGKSSLVNALTSHETAIVTAIAGTTRDIIETPLVVDGFRAIVADTAGLRVTDEVIEAEGVRRARVWAEGADLRLWVVDRSAGDGAWREAAGAVREGDVCVLNKADLPAGPDACEARAAAEGLGLLILELSVTQRGAEAVCDALSARIQRDLAGADFPAATRARHEALLRAARDHLRRALAALDTPELAAEDARLAARALAQVSGRVGAEDVLERVFATFCIGK